MKDVEKRPSTILKASSICQLGETRYVKREVKEGDTKMLRSYASI